MLERARAPLRRYPVPAFLAISYLWSWWPWIAALARGTQAPGIDPFGPAIAALLVVAAAEGRSGVTRLLRACVRRPGVLGLAFALGVPVVLSAGTAVLAVALGSPRPPAEAIAAWPRLLVAFPVVLVLAGPLGEEPGWRGFLLPRLRDGRSELDAALRVGAVWAGWHLPLMLGPAREQWLPLALGIVAAAVVFAALDRRTGGSVLAAMLLHASQNTVGGEYLGPMFSGAAAVRLAWLRAAAYALLAAALVARDPRRWLRAAWPRRTTALPATELSPPHQP
jgi:membrane protease YdiL (CAAX protease family)